MTIRKDCAHALSSLTSDDWLVWTADVCLGYTPRGGIAPDTPAGRGKQRTKERTRVSTPRPPTGLLLFPPKGRKNFGELVYVCMYLSQGESRNTNMGENSCTSAERERRKKKKIAYSQPSQKRQSHNNYFHPLFYL